MRLQDIHSIDDLEAAARRRLPSLMYDFIAGGAGDEQNLHHNKQQFERYRIVPRYLVDVKGRTQKTTLFGREYGSLFGISATGYAGFYRPDGEIMLAKAAAEADIPVMQSCVSVASVETLSKVAPRNLWFQLYAARDPKISEDLLRRAADAGVETLAVTIDLPVPGPRPRDLRSGFKIPPKITPRILFDAMCHPLWSLGVLRMGGLPKVGNWVPYAPPGSTALQVAAFMRTHSFQPQTWPDIERFRKQWKGNLVLKGILHPDDARTAAEVGVDGVIVSNHGGRQFDRSPSSLEALPAVVEAVGSRMTVMVDSGFTSGSDIVLAYALGAKYVFVGRATAWGMIAGGYEGAKRAVDILRWQIDSTMGQIGCLKPADLPNMTVMRV